MQETDDDLEQLLRTIRKNILDNDQFLKTLDDAPPEKEACDQPAGAEEPVAEGDDFEEL